MALPFLPVPAFPDVPQLPGVPPLARSALSVVAGPQIIRLTTDVGIVKSLLGIHAAPQWGIFSNDKKTPILTGDAVISLAPTVEMHVADYPIEDGGFQSYNKVATPAEVVMTIAKGGTQADRGAFIRQLEMLRSSLSLYAVVAPDSAYTSMNVVGVRYERRASEGVQLITADIRLREIRLAPPPAFSSTKSPASAAAREGGPVQAQPPTAGQQPALVGGGVK